MSWLYSGIVARIYPCNKFYFLTAERSQNGYFKIYSPESVAITTDAIKRLPSEDTLITTVPRDFILKLNPQRDFVIKTRLTINNQQLHFDKFALGEVLTKNTLNNNAYLTHAIISAAEPCLDFDNRILFISNGVFVPKFKDDQIIQKLTHAMHEAIQLVRTDGWSTFTMSHEEVTVTVEVSLSAEAKHRFTSKDCGTFKLT